MNMLIDRLKNLSPLGIAALIAIPVLLGLIGFVLVARAVNTAPSLCASCHPEMTDLYKTGKTHPQEKVTCYECHADHASLPEGFNIAGYVRDLFIPERYMASAERLEGRCLPCHSDIPKADKEKAKFIKVNHKAHLAGEIVVGGQKVLMGCLDCHDSIAHDRTATPTNRPTMAGCFSYECHAKERNKDSCLVCHYQVLIEKVTAAEETISGAQEVMVK